MPVDCKSECWHECWRELAPLWELQYGEVGSDPAGLPLDLDIDAFGAMWDAGQLCVIVARTKERGVIGYHVSVVRTHLHHKTMLCAFVDMFYVLPEYRHGTGAGAALMDEAERLWKLGAVRKAFAASKMARRLNVLYERRGWIESETHFCKTLTE